MKITSTLLALSLLSSSAFAATTGINPSALKLKIYKVAISTSALCTNPVTVFENSAATYADFLAGPTLGSGSVPIGTYPCVMIEFSSKIKPTPSVTSTGTGACVAGTAFDLYVCRTGNTSTLIDGTVVNCADNVDTRVAMYLSTASTSTNNSDAFSPPTSVGDALHGFKLAAALEVTATSAGVFVVNGAGTIQEQGASSCECQPPTFSFR